MAHIPTPAGLPGIVSLFATRPETAKPMSELAEVLLRGPSVLSRGERELIATYVSSLNQCRFCTNSHAAIAQAQLSDPQLAEQVQVNFESAAISDKLKSFLKIAGKVQKDARTVSSEDIALAKSLGATDVEIHDVVLIAAAFCMYNKYVDGLASFTPENKSDYTQTGFFIAEKGYMAALQQPAHQ